MDQSALFANRGAPVSIDAIDVDRIDDMTLGELAYAQALFGQRLSQRLADPDALHEVATFANAAGADWSGFHTDQEATPEPVAPEKYVDSLPATLDLLNRADRLMDASLANIVRLLETAQRNQTDYLGVPHGINGFQKVQDILCDKLRMSRQRANKLVDRARYIAYASTTDRTPAGAAPRLPLMAAAYTVGDVSTENLEKIIALDTEAEQYSAATGNTPEYKNAVIELFEPSLVEAAETETPRALGQAKQRWMEHLAHHIAPDGPSPSQTRKKQPDNALHVRNHDDGSATASLHMDPMWAAFVAEFLNTNLNYRGNMPLLPENIQNLYEAMADAKATHNHKNNTTDATETADTADQDTDAADTAGAANDASQAEAADTNQTSTDGAGTSGRRQSATTPEAELPHPVDQETVVAEDAHGTTYTRRQVEWIDTLTRAERAGVVVLGALYRMMCLPPDEAVKQAHGTPAKLVIVQDIQTAYHTLGLPELPEAVQRPDGPDGVLPTVIKHPNPNHASGPPSHEPPPDDDPDTDGGPVPDDGFRGLVNPVAWTRYQSEAVNIGPIHPANARPALCDVALVGQIWNGDDIVLNEYRDKRLFTAAQRRAIFARDKGCQAPGCTIQATYCQCHHRQAWNNDGHTNETNAITLCARHHTDIHNGKWTIHTHHGRTYFQPAPWLDPSQPLLRNLYWNI